MFCAAMLGVRNKVCEHDLERVMTDAVSLFVSFAPAGHAALLCLSHGRVDFAAAVVAGLTGAALGAAAQWLGLPERLRAAALVLSFFGACALASLFPHGHMCLVAWSSASVARAYEIGVRSHENEIF